MSSELPASGFFTSRPQLPPGSAQSPRAQLRGFPIEDSAETTLGKIPPNGDEMHKAIDPSNAVVDGAL